MPIPVAPQPLSTQQQQPQPLPLPPDASVEEATEALIDSLVQSLTLAGDTDATARPTPRISNQAEYDATTAWLTERIQPALDEIDRTFDESIKQAHHLHKQLLAKKRQVAAPWQSAKDALLAARTAFRSELERQQLAERAQLEAAMRKQAEADAMERAKALYAEGKIEEGDALFEQLTSGGVAPSIELPETVVRRPKSRGTAVRDLSRFRVVDASKVAREFLIPDLKAIQAAVDQHGKAAEKLVGEGSIEVFTRQSEAVRSAK